MFSESKPKFVHGASLSKQLCMAFNTKKNNVKHTVTRQKSHINITPTKITVISG